MLLTCYEITKTGDEKAMADCCPNHESQAGMMNHKSQADVEGCWLRLSVVSTVNSPRKCCKML